jgi:hypothetical protein
MEPGAVTLLVAGCNKGDVGCRDGVRDVVGDKVGEVLDPLAFLAKFHTLWITEGLRLRFAGLSLPLSVLEAGDMGAGVGIVKVKGGTVAPHGYLPWAGSCLSEITRLIELDGRKAWFCM